MLDGLVEQAFSGRVVPQEKHVSVYNNSLELFIGKRCAERRNVRHAPSGLGQGVENISNKHLQEYR